MLRVAAFAESVAPGHLPGDGRTARHCGAAEFVG